MVRFVFEAEQISSWFYLLIEQGDKERQDSSPGGNKPQHIVLTTNIDQLDKRHEIMSHSITLAKETSQH